MAVTEALRDAITPGPALPREVKERLDRARASMKKQAAPVNECYEFWRGNQYVFVNSQNYLVAQGTVTNPDGTGKPRHRARQTWNLIHPIIEAKVSAATQRVPSYEVVPASTDNSDEQAAHLASQVAIYGYEQWDLRRVTMRTVTHALVSGEGFAMPYFDTSVGPYVRVPDEDGSPGEESVGQGEVKVKVLGKNEVGWEDGCEFEDSPWFVIVQGRTAEQVKALPGYIGPQKLDFDAKTSDILGKSKQGEKLVMVWEYVERPSPERPDGIRLTIANGRLVTKPEPYPCRDAKGNVKDMPILHRLSYTVDPEEERDRGLVRHLIDPQRVFNDCNNKLVEWKNLALFPQSYGLPNVLRTKKTDEPGAHYIVNSMDGIQWVPTPTVPNDLYRIKEEAQQAMNVIAATSEVPSQVESARGIQAIIERSEQSWAQFVTNLATWHSNLMRHCLYLVQNFYTEERLIKVRGDFGWDRIEDFRGAQIKDQIDVRVFPGSLEPLTKNAVEQKVMNIVQTFPGWISPERAVAAIESGDAHDLIKGYEAAKGRAEGIIQRMREGMQALQELGSRPLFPGEQPPVIDGQIQTDAPGWMPRPFDSIAIHKKVFEDWLQTPDYEQSPPEVQEVANLYYAALLDLEAQQAQRAAEQQQMAAEQAGMNNASGPQAQQPPSKPMPSLPALNGGGGPNT